MKLKSLVFVNCFAILTTVLLQDSRANFPWIQNLVKYIEKDLRISRVLFIIDDQNDAPKHTIDNIMGKIRFIPHNIIGMKNATFDHAKQMSEKSQFQDIQSTTLVLTILSLENKRFTKVFDLAKFLIPLHANESRTKCLTIVSTGVDRLRYRNFLHQMWLNDFLDFTILEISQKEKNCTRFESRRSENVRIHRYNPFTNVYKMKNYSSRKQPIFVNKLRNMNGFTMNVGTFNLPPFVFVKRNSTRHPVLVSGPTTNMIREFANKMNFKTVEAPSQEEWFGLMNRAHDDKKIPSLVNQLLNKRIRLITNWALYGGKTIFCRTKVIDFDRLCALIPAPEKSNWHVSYQWSWIYFLILVMILKGITWMMKFDDQLWSVDYILEVMLGFTVHREPRNRSERIVFMSMLILFMIFSSSIFAILTDMKITMGPMTVIDTLEKLNGSNLTPMMRKSYRILLKTKKEPIVQDLLRKSLSITNEDECVQMAVKHRNVTCFLRQTLATLFIQKYKNSDGSFQLEIVKEILNFYPQSMLLESGSPFVNGFNKIIKNLLEFGVISHWFKSFTFVVKEIENLVNLEELSLLPTLINILLAGYFISFVVFVAEIVVNYSQFGIKIKISGKAFTRWVIPSHNGSRQIRGHEKYFSSKFYLVGGKSDEMELNTGEHIFPFEYVLPQKLPTSYELKLVNTEAHVRYIVKAIIDRPWKFDNEAEAPFTVISKYDLNADPIAVEQVFLEETKTFGIFSNSPPLTVRLSLPFRGYVPGQTVPIQVNVNNRSGVEVNDIKLKLEMYATYSQVEIPSRSMKKKVNMSIIETKKDKTEENVFSFNHGFRIPPVPPSNIGFTCSIISIEYAIELEAEVDRMLSRNLKISTPIVIGTMPLSNYVSSVNPSLMTISPVYEKSMFVVEDLWEGNDSEHLMVRQKFSPKYPVYNFSASQEL